jgi:hypothetical protein
MENAELEELTEIIKKFMTDKHGWHGVMISKNKVTVNSDNIVVKIEVTE